MSSSPRSRRHNEPGADPCVCGLAAHGREHLVARGECGLAARQAGELATELSN